MSFMVVTDKGTRAYDNKGDGFSEKAAQVDADRRNAKAEQLGIKARYEVAPFRPRGD